MGCDLPIRDPQWETCVTFIAKKSEIDVGIRVHFRFEQGRESLSMIREFDLERLDRKLAT
jgi:hypothetical protein